MTTFARMEAHEEGWSAALELRSVNGRYCDVHIRLPKWMVPLEERIRKRVQASLVRGRVELGIKMEPREGGMPRFEPDIELGRSYLEAVRALSDSLDVEGSLDLSTLLATLKDVIRVRECEQDTDETWKRLEPLLTALLEKAGGMAEQEAAALCADLESRLRKTEKWIEEIQRESREHFEEAKRALEERIQKLLQDIPVDQARMAQEVAILVDRLDITEEVVRAKSHIEQFRVIVERGGPAGRKLDFLLQELFREVNTMASKSSNARIAHAVVEIKGELEKMREQVQNLV